MSKISDVRLREELARARATIEDLQAEVSALKEKVVVQSDLDRAHKYMLAARDSGGDINLVASLSWLVEYLRRMQNAPVSF